MVTAKNASAQKVGVGINVIAHTGVALEGILDYAHFPFVFPAFCLDPGCAFLSSCDDASIHVLQFLNYRILFKV